MSKRKPADPKQRLRDIDQIHAELADIEERCRALDIPNVRIHIEHAIVFVEDAIVNAGFQPGRVP